MLLNHNLRQISPILTAVELPVWPAGEPSLWMTTKSGLFFVVWRVIPIKYTFSPGARPRLLAERGLDRVQGRPDVRRAPVPAAVLHSRTARPELPSAGIRTYRDAYDFGCGRRRSGSRFAAPRSACRASISAVAAGTGSAHRIPEATRHSVGVAGG